MGRDGSRSPGSSRNTVGVGSGWGNGGRRAGSRSPRRGGGLQRVPGYLKAEGRYPPLLCSALPCVGSRWPVLPFSAARRGETPQFNETAHPRAHQQGTAGTPVQPQEGLGRLKRTRANPAAPERRKTARDGGQSASGKGVPAPRPLSGPARRPGYLDGAPQRGGSRPPHQLAVQLRPPAAARRRLPAGGSRPDAGCRGQVEVRRVEAKPHPAGAGELWLCEAKGEERRNERPQQRGARRRGHPAPGSALPAPGAAL